MTKNRCGIRGGGGCGRPCAWRLCHVADDDRPGAREVEAAQLRTRAELCGAAELDEEHRDRGRQLAQLARKLVRTVPPLLHGIATQHINAPRCDRVDNRTKGGVQSGRETFGVVARVRHRVHGQCRAKRCAQLVLRVRANPRLKVRDAVHLGKHHVHRQSQSEFARCFGESLTQRYTQRGELLPVGALIKDVARNAHHGGARCSPSRGHRGRDARCTQCADHLRPARPVTQQRTREFHDDGLLHGPDIGRLRGRRRTARLHDGVAGQQLRVAASMANQRGLGPARRAKDDDHGSIGKAVAGKPIARTGHDQQHVITGVEHRLLFMRPQIPQDRAGRHQA